MIVLCLGDYLVMCKKIPVYVCISLSPIYSWPGPLYMSVG